MSMLFSAAGSRIYIGGARQQWKAASADADTFAGEAWLEVAGLTDLGEIEGQWRTNETVLPSLDPSVSPMVYHEKVAKPARTMRVIVDLLPDDAGQAAVGEAEESEDAFAFRLVFPTGGVRSFVALVVSADLLMGQGNIAVALAYSLILQSNVVKT